MVTQVPLQLQGMDAFSALGLGLLLAALYDAVRFFLGGAKPVVFFCDLLFFALSAAAAVSFGVSYSYTGFLRWYIAAGMAAGYAAYFFAVAPFTAALRRGLLFLLLLPWRLLKRYVIAPLGKKLGAHREKRKKKRREKKKRKKEPLQPAGKVLYNSN
ncbi:hypothetical protein H8S23_10965 [Anaerofilum sp. BX8]|uniref:Spore cortex biosynthesis protein YabQ n=1 Tax=Anaerofilum hominis TaxID=2763016 RepID=A0A923IAT5_9FIRM|nr:spore cortex biosynthesis protein YabQ [Anaerofilum hominis]MBC5582026.1 hypothetical protein [Anaerofilum hominis]